MTDSNDLTLITFVPGTKAKADEVNSNFSTLSDAIKAKAAKMGDSTQNFSVADATDSTHAVNKSQLTNLSNNLTDEINKFGTKFCVKSGYTTNGVGDLFSYSGLKITPKIAGTYGSLVIVDYAGTQTTISTAPTTIDLTGNSSGTYNIFINSSGELYILNNTIYKQAERPTMVVNDVWLNTSAEPLKCIKYSGTGDSIFTDVPLGKVTIASNSISSIETFPFNQNGYNVTAQTELGAGTNLASSISNLIMPDYANGSSKSWATVYQASSDGYLYIWANFGSTLNISLDNSTWIKVQYSWFSDQGYSSSSFIPIPKGIYYKATSSSTTSSNSLVFYPCLGA